MSTLTRKRIRIAADAALPESPQDQQTGASPHFWRGNDVQFEIGVFNNSVLQSVSNLASLTLEIKAQATDGGAPSPDDPLLMAATVTSLDDSTDAATWADGSRQHALVVFAANESNIAAGDHWFAIRALTSDNPGRTVTLAAGPIVVLEDGAGLATEPPNAIDTFYTSQESDARYLNQADNLADLPDAAAARGALGLGNVDNTADADKPVSTAQQAALDLKADASALANLSGVSDAAAARGALSVYSQSETDALIADSQNGMGQPATLPSYFFNGTSDCACDIELDADYGAASNPLSMQIQCVQVMPTAPGNNVCLAVFTSVPLASDDLTSALLFYVEATTGKFCVRLYGTDGVSYREVKSTGTIYNAALRFDMVHVAISGAGVVSVWIQGSALTFDAATTSGASAPASFSEVKSTAYLSIAEAPASASMAHYGGKVYGVSLFNLAISATDVAASLIDPTYLRTAYGWAGGNLIQNGTFDSATNWDDSDTGWTVSGGVASYTQAISTEKYLRYTPGVNIVAGKKYLVSFDVSGAGADAVIRFEFNRTGTNNWYFSAAEWSEGTPGFDSFNISNGHYAVTMTAIRSGTDLFISGGTSFFGANTDFTIDNLSIQEVGTFADWPMNEGIGYLLHDRSPNCYHGVLAASTGWVPNATEGVIKGRVSFAAESSTKNLIADKRLLPANARILSIEAEVAGSNIQNFSIGDGTSATRWAASGNGTAGFKVITPANRIASGTTDAVNKVTVTPAASATMTVDLWIKYRVDPQV